jgi:hypothetical protein
MEDFFLNALLLLLFQQPQIVFIVLLFQHLFLNLIKLACFICCRFWTNSGLLLIREFATIILSLLILRAIRVFLAFLKLC